MYPEIFSIELRIELNSYISNINWNEDVFWGNVFSSAVVDSTK